MVIYFNWHIRYFGKAFVGFKFSRIHCINLWLDFSKIIYLIILYLILDDFFKTYKERTIRSIGTKWYSFSRTNQSALWWQYHYSLALVTNEKLEQPTYVEKRCSSTLKPKLFKINPWYQRIVELKERIMYKLKVYHINV